MDIEYVILEIIAKVDKMTRELKPGFRIWEIQQNLVPKEIAHGDDWGEGKYDVTQLDLENKTYAIRIGKDGLK